MINSQSVQETVFSSLREDIITMRLLPGTGVSVYEISQKLNVSRTPVREAFIRLDAESLVQILPQRKTLVSLIDISRVKQERFLREALELAAIPRFLRLITPESVRRMKRLCREYADTVNSGDAVRAMEIDDKFHREIYLGAGQTLSWKAVDKTNGHYRRMRLMMIRESAEAVGAVDEHERIIAAIEAGDEEMTVGRDREHLRKIVGLEETLRMKYPSCFV